MNRKQRLLLFVYGTPNIVGCVLALLGLALYFGGIIGPFWWLIVPGLYAIGWLLTPKGTTQELRLRQELSADEIRDELEDLVRSIRKKVPKEIMVRVESIKQSILAILPYIADVNSSDHNVYVIRQTALDYLPEALQNYLNLPPVFAAIHPVRNGKTAKQLLAEQLDLLDRQMREIVEDIHRNDTQKLIVHGRFLEDKFRTAEPWFE
jgi:hypothetical protein